MLPYSILCYAGIKNNTRTALAVCGVGYVFADHPTGIKNNTRAMWLEFNFDVCTLCYAGI